MRFFEFAIKENVNIDNRDGWGAVPWNQDVDYRGLRVKMKPSTFLALAKTLNSNPKPDIVQHIRSGGAIGAPFLQIRVDEKDSKPEVVGHDGRNRMKSILKIHGDIPVETHLFLQGAINRARHLTPEIVRHLNSGANSENNTYVKGPLFRTKQPITEGYKLQLERGKDMDVLHITDTKTGRRTEVRGKPDYERAYDANDQLHQLLDRIGKSANISDLINGEPVGINPRHPDGASAKAHTDTAFGEDDEQYRDMRRLLVTPEHPLGKYLYHLTGADGLLGMLKDGHLGDHDEYFSMTADPKYDVGGGSGWTKVNIIIDAAKVKKLETFEKHMENWEWGDHGSGDWAKQPGNDWESEYRVEEAIPLSAVVAVKILKSAVTPEIVKLAKQRNIKLIGKDTSVQENFADGKVKGKSRPGRVKRSGASCKGSVTDLRAKAKKYSGERGKMYHWCANMKAGKKKK